MEECVYFILIDCFAKKSVRVYISIKIIYESALLFKRLSFKNITHVFLTNVKGKKCYLIVMSLCFSDSSKVECHVHQPFGSALL